MNIKDIRKSVNGGFAPTLEINHENAKGTGCAMRMRLIPAEIGKQGGIEVALANQSSVRRYGDPTSHAEYDWDNANVAWLDLTTVGKLLGVIRGYCEKIDGTDRGIYTKFDDGHNRLTFDHLVEVNGYALSIWQSEAGMEGENDRRTQFLMTEFEAVAVGEALATSLRPIAFGI